MRVLITEDEELLSRKLVKMVTVLEPQAEVIGITNSVDSTIKWLTENGAPDLMLMDIELADGQCFEIFQQLDITCPVIFCTAYDEFAVQAFKVNSLDYLLKPIREAELKTALQKFKINKSRWQPVRVNSTIDFIVRELMKAQDRQNPLRSRLLVKLGQKMISINVDEVAYFFVKNGLNFFYTKNKQRHVIEQKLDDIEKQVDPNLFFRANRQFIVRHDAVVFVQPWTNGKLKVELNPPFDEEVIVSRDKANAFKEWLGG